MGYRLQTTPRGSTAAAANTTQTGPVKLPADVVRKADIEKMIVERVNQLTANVRNYQDKQDAALTRVAKEVTKAIDLLGTLGDRSNHSGQQPIESVNNLTTVLATKANRSDLHSPLILSPDSSPGLHLDVDKQELRFTAPKIYAEQVATLADVTEPKFGVVYVTATEGSFMLNQDASQWVLVAAAGTTVT